MHDRKNTPSIGVKHILISIVFNIPIIGWMLRDLHLGRDSAMGFFGANILMLWLLAGFLWGITGALAGAYVILPLYALVLLTIMRS
ncbi:MAG: hypothetical protein AB3N28_03070 [Kordiimonas sp.]